MEEQGVLVEPGLGGQPPKLLRLEASVVVFEVHLVLLTNPGSYGTLFFDLQLLRLKAPSEL